MPFSSFYEMLSKLLMLIMLSTKLQYKSIMCENAVSQSQFSLGFHLTLAA